MDYGANWIIFTIFYNSRPPGAGRPYRRGACSASSSISELDNAKVSCLAHTEPVESHLTHF